MTIPASPPRPARALPEQVASLYPMPSAEPVVTFDSEQRWEGFVRHRGSFAIGEGPAVAMELFQPDGEGPHPFVVVLPYLEGSYSIPRLLCKSLARNGIASGFLERPADILAAHQTGESSEKLFEKTISCYRSFLQWVGRKPEMDGERIGLVGISLGAIMGTALMAAEPRLSKGMLILPGGDIPGILLRSRETKVIEYMQARGTRDDLRPEQIADDFRKHFLSDPLNLAPFVDPREILMITARYDGVIPRDCSDRLWEELGKPERVLIPTGHGTTGFALPYIESRMIRLFTPPRE